MGAATSACCSIDKIDDQKSVFVADGSQQNGQHSSSSSSGGGGAAFDPVRQTGYTERRFADGGVFQGYLQNGLKHGYGKYVYPDGVSVYEGQWKDDKCEGQGKVKDEESEYIFF
eukprot:g4495.t1